LNGGDSRNHAAVADGVAAALSVARDVERRLPF